MAKDKIPEKMTKIQEQVIIGSMIGDGSMKRVRSGFKNSENKTEAISSSFNESHGMEQTDYLQWKYNILKDFCNKGLSFNKNRNTYSFYTLSCSIFTDLEKEWYLRNKDGFYILNKRGHRIKIIPQTLMLTPLSLAIWYLDDGNLSYNNNKNRTIRIFTDGFFKEDCLFLIEKLKEIGIKNCNLYNKIKCDTNYYEIHILANSFIEFLDLIKEGLKELKPPECMNYKYILCDYKEPINFGENFHSTKYSNSKVLEVLNLANQGKGPKEIIQTTKTSKGFVSGILYKNNRKDIIKNKLINSEVSRKNTSGVTGVYYNKLVNKWVAQIYKNGKNKHLGIFSNKEDAIEARRKAEK